MKHAWYLRHHAALDKTETCHPLPRVVTGVTAGWCVRFHVRRLALLAEGMMNTGPGTWKNACHFERMLYFTGDTHFGDPRVLRIDRRPFATMREHDAALIRNWNEVVSVDDEVCTWAISPEAPPPLWVNCYQPLTGEST